MLEEPKIKKVDKRDKQLPQNFEQLIEMYDIEKIWPYIKRTIDYINNDLEKVKVSPTEPTTNEKVWIQHSKNLFNKNDYSLDHLGRVGFNVRDLELGKTYTLSSNKPLYIAKFSNTSDQANDNVGPQKWANFTSWTFVAGNNVNNYLNNRLFLGIVSSSGNAVSQDINDFADYNIQIEEGPGATEYEPYIDKKIWCKNDNGVFEEFVNIDTMGIQTITNDNGTAIKYPDGKMICTKKVDILADVTIATGSLYQSTDIDLGQFAGVFTELPTCVINLRSNNYVGFIGYAKDMSTTNVGTIRIYRPTSSASNTYTVHIEAIGRWK